MRQRRTNKKSLFGKTSKYLYSNQLQVAVNFNPKKGAEHTTNKQKVTYTKTPTLQQNSCISTAFWYFVAPIHFILVFLYQ
jgi:hypothetical protein